MKAKVYYGISGTLKRSTIESTLSPSTIPVWSSIKTWKSIEEKLPSEYKWPGNLKFGLLHLVNLSNIIFENPGKDLVIERGITDSLFFENKINSLHDGLVESSVTLESEILAAYDVTKILLIMEDPKFISQVILSNKYRREVLGHGLQDYLHLQEEYVKFTESLNKINEVIRITDAREYITKNLGQELKINF